MVPPVRELRVWIVDAVLVLVGEGRGMAQSAKIGVLTHVRPKGLP
jgi:hypothetical protein